MYIRQTSDVLMVAWLRASNHTIKTGRLFGWNSHQFYRAKFLENQRFVAYLYPQFN